MFKQSLQSHAIVLLTALMSPVFATHALAQSPTVPRALADVKIKTPEAPIDLKKFRGKPLIIGLVSTSCSHCKTAMEALGEIKQTMGPKGMQVLGAAGDPVPLQKILEFSKSANIHFPFGYIDQPQFVQLADLKPGQRPFVPVMIYVDRNGIVRSQVFGDAPGMRQDVHSAILYEAALLLKADLDASKRAVAKK
jgi:thiol-disulfide isomerase/thioredoxin